MSDLVLAGGLVLTDGDERVADVVISDGKIAAIDPEPGSRRGASVVDCSGAWVGPGLVDLHVHLREPGFEHKEDIASGSAAAAAGGFTAVVAMPNTTPAIDNPAIVEAVRSRAASVGLVDVYPAGALTVGRSGEELAPFASLYAVGVRVFSDDGDTLFDERLLEGALREVGRLGGVVSQHAIHPELGSGHVHDGDHATALGVAGIPSRAETSIVARDLDLVRRTGAAYHLQHVSAAGSVDLIVAAKREGLPVTAEVTPHHLAFVSEHVGEGDTHFKMMPPLREREDRTALRTALRIGDIDAVATDHAPHAPEEKAATFKEAPFGVIGLEQAAAVVNTVTDLAPREFFTRMSVTPAMIGRITGHGRWPAPGNDANITVFDPAASGPVPTVHSRSANDPFANRSWVGRVRLTVLRGRVTHAAGASMSNG